MEETIGYGLIPILNNTAWQLLISKYDVTFKSWESSFGEGYAGSLKSGRNKIAEFREDGDGSEMVIHRLKGGKPTLASTDEYDQFLRIVAVLPLQESRYEGFEPEKPDAATVIAVLTDISDLKKTARAINKKGQVVFLKTDGDQEQLVEVTGVSLKDGKVSGEVRKRIKRDNPISYVLNDLA